MESSAFMASKNHRKSGAIKVFRFLLHRSKDIVKKWMIPTTIQMSLFFFSTEKYKKTENSVKIYTTLVYSVSLNITSHKFLDVRNYKCQLI